MQLVAVVETEETVQTEVAEEMEETVEAEDQAAAVEMYETTPPLAREARCSACSIV